MHYCMSDIHGEYDRFIEMLKLIQFTEDDYLFVIGDTIDRFRDGVRVLRHIMAEPNMFLIKGNHEKLLYDDIGPVYNYQAKELWLMNGGSRTRRDLMYRCTRQERHDILRYIERAPTMVPLAVPSADGFSENRFLLVHGYPAQDEETRLWKCITPDMENIIPGVTVIVGHTVTCRLTEDYDTPFRIWKKPGLVDIDCGCGNRTPLRRLACLRLEDMREFYV